MRRVVITGIGMITPVGLTMADSWSNLVAGVSGAGPITQFDCEAYRTRFACEVTGWDPLTHFDKREAKHLDRFLQFGVAAGLDAMRDAGYEDLRIPEEQAERFGVYVGAGLGGVHTIEETYTRISEKGPRHGVSPYFITDVIINMVPGMLSIKTGAKGPNLAHVSACSTGAHSIGEAARAIRWDDADVMLAGGSESVVSSLGIGGFSAMRALSKRNEDPATASRPFDAERDGFVMGEGGACLVLEELGHAKARGARIYAEVSGYGANSDAFHVTRPAPNGEGAQRCMKKALRDAKFQPKDIGYINAHGTSTAVNDKEETAAIKAVFEEHASKIAVSSTKSMTGHMLGAAGAVEAAVSALAIHHGILPPTINQYNSDPDCDLDYVPNEARECVVDAVMSNSFGFGGTNATLIVSRFRD